MHLAPGFNSRAQVIQRLRNESARHKAECRELEATAGRFEVRGAGAILLRCCMVGINRWRSVLLCAYCNPPHHQTNLPPRTVARLLPLI